MKITIEESGREVIIDNPDVVTWFDGFDLFADALRGAGFQLPFTNDTLRSAIDIALTQEEGNE